ncbi:PAS domain-containing protein [Vreelandella lionensis]|uniref:PAS domain-containing protein n=1 Tax=Vreelandella lionensis TaxID=1144478 RepID=UPI001FB2E8D9
MPPVEPQGKLDQFFLLSQDLFCCIDFAGTLLSINPTFESLLGYQAEALLGRPCGVVVEPRDHPVIEAALARVCRGEKINAFDICALAVDGRRVWLEVSASAGEQVIYVIARDITRRKAVEKQLRRNQRLFRIAVRQHISAAGIGFSGGAADLVGGGVPPSRYACWPPAHAGGGDCFLHAKLSVAYSSRVYQLL